MKLLLEVPDDMPEDQLAQLREAAKDGMMFVFHRPPHFTNEMATEFAGNAVQVLSAMEAVAEAAGLPEMQPAWRSGQVPFAT